jgi:hypothetical protein
MSQFPFTPGSGGFGFSRMAEHAQRVPLNDIDADFIEAQAAREEAREAADQPGPGPLVALGIDLGTMQDFTAVTIVQREGRQPADWRYIVRYIKRFELGTSYPTIIRAIASMVGNLANISPENTSCVWDVTGCGLAVYQTALEANIRCRQVGVLITSGRAVTRDPKTKIWHCSKHELLSGLLAIFNSGKLQLVEGLALASLLRKECEALTVHVNTSGGEQVEALRRGGHHDDVVLSLALSIFQLSRSRRSLAMFRGSNDTGGGGIRGRLGAIRGRYFGEKS